MASKIELRNRKKYFEIKNYLRNLLVIILLILFKKYKKNEYVLIKSKQRRVWKSAKCNKLAVFSVKNKF